MMNTILLRVLAGMAYLIVAVDAQITFDCNAIPETCNNMCFAANRGVYFEMHFDSNTANRPGRRRAAGCLPNPNRCNSNPPAAGRTTCDEYPFASTHGTGTGGWFSNTGATTRCVSPAECVSQGGSLSAFYRSFNRVDQTPVDVFVENFSNTVAPWCNNAGMAPDADFQTGVQPPNRRDSVVDGFGTGVEPPNKRADPAVYMYRTAANRTVRALTGPADIGSELFIPSPNWQNHPKVKRMLAGRQDDPEDGCTGTETQAQAASLLSNDELGETDKIVERL
ncbi:hypothetical protein V5O48_012938 [Marasmius crinis-equi]|uniref:Deoxyribonuclease NucA/NucB domain-containing protein n=1 Tax=Marasmius crinis-equi TaxID=585013 RepID=A0ABR3F1H4_9AGAR